MLHNVLTSIELLKDACRSFRDRCTASIELTRLMTLLNLHIGCENAVVILPITHREDAILPGVALEPGVGKVERFDAWYPLTT